MSFPTNVEVKVTGASGNVTPELRILAEQSRANAEAARNASSEAMDYRDDASVYAAAAQANSNVYPNVQSGLNDTPSGKTFNVQSTNADNAYDVYRNNNGTAVFLTSVSSSVGVEQKTIFSERLSVVRKTLYKAFDKVPLPEYSAYKPYIDNTFNGARFVSTDVSQTPLWAPNTTNAYGAIWCRDMFMAMMMAPERFTWIDISSAYDWYKNRVNLPIGPLGPNQQFPGWPQVDLHNRTQTNDYWVPDHINIDGSPVYFPGPTVNQTHPNTWGQRSPTDGNTWLMCGAWLVWAKSGDTTIYNRDKDFLWNLLASIPTQNGLLYVDPTRRFVNWGFEDTINTCGGVAMGSVQLADAWRRLSDMAFGAGDVDMAIAAMDKADEVIAGIKTLFVNMPAVDVPQGALLASNGPVSSGQYSVWANALAVYFDVVDPDMAHRIAGWLNTRFYAPPVSYAGGKNDFYSPGGVRHIMRSNDYQGGVRAWEQGFFGDPISSDIYDTYQYGANWWTPVAWLFDAIGRVFPQTVRIMRQINIQQFAREQQIVVAGGSIFPGEWFRTETGQYADAVRYLASAAALVAIDARIAGGELPKMRTRLVMTQSQNVPKDVYTKIPYSQVDSGVDQMGSALIAQNGFRATLTGRYNLLVHAEFGKHGRSDGSPWGGYRLSIYVNGAERLPGQDIYIGQDIEPAAFINAQIVLNEGDVLDVRGTTYQNGVGTTPLLFYAIPQADINIRYNFAELSWMGFQ